MDQKVWILDRETLEGEVESRLQRAARVVAGLGSLDGTLQDLSVLQKAVDGLIVPLTDTLAWQALGMAFGRVLKNELNLEWVMVDDEYGRDPALRHPRSETLLFPLTMISKRIEKRERPDVTRLFQMIRTDMATRYHKMEPPS